jgi:hypothetical protein
VSSVKVEFEGEKLNVGLDIDKDGENSLALKLHLSEAVQEIFNKGGKVEGVKLASFEFQLTKLVLKLDTDQDGEPVMDLTIDLAEVFAELVKK